jgi:AbiV family abortive infection protein
LLNDARLLLSSGSPGSSLSLAILAFEEAGKRHVIELALEKPKVVHSHHEFRHFVSLFVLAASLHQKHELDTRTTDTKIQAYFQKKGVKPKGRISLPPMDGALRADLRAEMTPPAPEDGP